MNQSGTKPPRLGAKQRAHRAQNLHSGHFAFMRAVVQGLDARKAWELYLRRAGENVDPRKVASTIAWIRAEFAAAARRESKPGTARLVLIDTARIGEATTRPTLEEFARERGMEGFSEAEQAEAYEAAFGGATRRISRRAQLVNRQLDALRWLEDLVAQDPRPGDAVSVWLTPALADRLERAGTPTLFALVERINGLGARWWSAIPGIGELKGSRIVDWLQMHEASLGMKIGAHVAKPRTQLLPAELEAIVPPSTALVPFEKFRVPAELDGSAGQYRGPRERCLLSAGNDYEAILAWLASKRAGEDSRPSATHRAYRKEAERLLLWCVLERGKALSSLSVEDATAYAAFLGDPPARWCGPRYQQRWSPLWRPLEGPLSAAALRQALMILRSMFAYLLDQAYLVGNPFAGMTLPRESSRKLGSRRTLSFDQWDFISGQLDEEQGSEVARRRARAIRWLYATGLRLAEIVGARCQDLSRVEYADENGSPAIGWMLHVDGKGGVERDVPVPQELIDELGDELARAGRARNVHEPNNLGIPILARFGEDGQAEPSSWSASGLYKAIQKFMERCALKMDFSDAAQVRRATTHWLRHTHASHAVNGRAGHAPVPLPIVKNNLGHSSIATTSQYLQTEEGARLRAMKGFWGKSKVDGS